MIDLQWLLLLIPACVWGGWWLARNTQRKAQTKAVKRLSTKYFTGLNYLLNEQPDKAIEVFLKLADVDKDTVETHLALGNLFRRRGEVDRAIRIHQNIIAKSSLNDEQRTQALLELGEDYMRAGLLDRAESLFSELLTRNDALAPSALQHLLAIYEQEKDWQQAIQHARHYEKVTGEKQAAVIGHYYCELAEVALQGGDVATAMQELRQARRYDKGSVRARLIEASIAMQEGDSERAIERYKDAVAIEPAYIPQVLPRLRDCFSDTPSGQEDYLAFLGEWVDKYAGVSLVVELAQQIEQHQGIPSALEFVAERITQRPTVRALKFFIDRHLRLASGTLSDEWKVLQNFPDKLLENQPVYRCINCGFSGNSHHWQCPGCKQWGSTKTIPGVLGE